MKSMSIRSYEKEHVVAALRESSPSPLALVVPSFFAVEVMNDDIERSSFVLPKQHYAKEQPSPLFVDRMPSFGRK